MHILVAGSRSWTDYDMLVEELNKLIGSSDDITIVSGGAKGADTLAKRYACEKGYKFIEVPAEWDKYGKSAGYKRNVKMHEIIRQDDERACVCFWDGKSKGTTHNFELAKSGNTPLYVYLPSGLKKLENTEF